MSQRHLNRPSSPASWSRGTARASAARGIVLLAAAALWLAPAAVPAQAPAAGTPNPAEFSDAGQQAFLKFQQEDYAGAIAILEGPFKSGQATYVDLALLGTLYLETGRAEDALAAFRVVADNEGADPAVLYNAGRAALAIGDLALAEQYLERSVLKVPLSPATRDLGLLRSAQGRVTEAFRFLRPWVARNPGDVEARVALISAGLQIDRAAEVGPLLQGLPEGDPRIDLLREEYLSRTGDVGAVAQDPGAKAILAAQDAMTQGEPQRALAILRQEVALSPNDFRPRSLEIRLLMTLQRLPEALKSAEAAVAAFPNNADAVYQRGVIHMGMQNPEAAESDLRRALELAPDHVPSMNDLAVVLSLQGKKDEAKALLERLIELSPDNKLALDNLQRMRQGSGG